MRKNRLSSPRSSLSIERPRWLKLSLCLCFCWIVSAALGSASASATIYRCHSQFGEFVPITARLLKIGTPQMVEALIPWRENFYVRTAAGASQIKKRQYGEPPTLWELESRYMKYQGTSFSMDLNCSHQQAGRCHGQFRNQGTSSKSIKTPLIIKPQRSLWDRRYPQAAAHAELSWAQREHLGFILRVFKSATKLTHSRTWSASGETKIFAENDVITVGAGADESLAFTSTFHQRIATIEVEVICKKSLPTTDQ